MRSASKRIVSKFKPKFEGPYEVMKVENNNVVIWKGGKSITMNVDQVRIYLPRERDKGVVKTDGLDGERSSAEQVEPEVQRRFHESCKWRKRPITKSLPLGAGTKKMTRREAAVERKVRTGRDIILQEIEWRNPNILSAGLINKSRIVKSIRKEERVINKF
ncbi:hypothetical protein NPIL_518981 [Nephila pilipes]|uniref:Uncharacterized protein n=1 Tax=Nephila pilipes TaxID=299642 RepID=A0A8X6P432_NEPPI|nr:hypothetical protein NPIL_518981 [Nephila pilipes]